MPTAVKFVIALLNWAIVIFFCVRSYSAASAKGRKSSGAVLTTILLTLFGSFVCAMISIVSGLDQNISVYFSPVFIALGGFAGLKLADRDKG